MARKSRGKVLEEGHVAAVALGCYVTDLFERKMMHRIVFLSLKSFDLSKKHSQECFFVAAERACR